MALTLNKTLSDVYANSYVDVDYADDYFANHFSTTKASAWAALTDDQKTYLLIQACRVLETIRFTLPVALWDEYQLMYNRRSRIVIDANLNRTPVKGYFYQALQFPRNLDIDPTTGAAYVPEPILMAQCEQASTLQSYDDSLAIKRMQGVTEDLVKVGSIETFQKYADGAALAATAVAPLAIEFARPYMIKTSAQLRRG